MFPLLDLDDDPLAATLGFSDPRTLCAITMACRRLRILADGAWAVLDKRIPEDERAGGSTPREKVLSAFVVHKDKKRMKDFAARGRKAAYLTPEKFKTQNYLLYVHMTNHAEKLVGSFFLNASDEGLRALVDNSESIEVPIEKKQLIGRLKDFVQMYQKPNAAFYHRLRDVESLARRAFRDIDIVIVALNRRTLKRHVFFQGDEMILSAPYNVFMPDVRFSGNSEARRVDISGARNWIMTSGDNERVMFRFLTLQFYFKGSEFGLKLSNSIAFI